MFNYHLTSQKIGDINMRIPFLLMCLSFVMLSQNLYGQERVWVNGQERDWLKGDSIGFDNVLRMRQYGIEEGDRSWKNRKKRVDISKVDFDLPDNLSVNFRRSDYIYYDFTASIVGDTGECGVCDVVYADSQFSARRELAHLIHHIGSRAFWSGDFLRIEGIGDDICLMLHNKGDIFFIRDFIAVRVKIDPQYTDAEKLARCIDQTLKEENDKLNALSVGLLEREYEEKRVYFESEPLREPKTFQELTNRWEEYSNETQLPFIYRISQNPSALCFLRWFTSWFPGMKEVGEPDSPIYCYKCRGIAALVCIESTVVSSRRGTKEKMIEFLAQDSIDLRRYINGTSTVSRGGGYRRQPGVSRFFLSTKFDHRWSKSTDGRIGNFSFDRRFGGFEGHCVCEVNFVRGNTVVSVFVPFSNEETRLPEKGISPTKVFSDSTSILDLRQIAWQIDQYLKSDPVEKLGDVEKTLEIVLPKDVNFEIGKEYPLDFPRKLPDGTVPAEIRLVVSRGEVQQVSENPTLAPEIDGKYTVLFGQSGQQTIRCYHLDEAGKLLAWGEVEVDVKYAPTAEITTPPASK
ncbi:MAG: hypothetical protein Q4D38_14945 [Planctomycetia bacterium]|nr:hypothetical protein [Planctomycetia bacterium]